MWIQYMCWCLGCLFKQIHDKTVHIRLHWRDYFSLWQKVCRRVLLRPETFNIPHSQSIFFTRNLVILSVFENQGVICTWTFPRLVIHPLHWNKPKSVHSEREFLFMTVLVVVQMRRTWCSTKFTWQLWMFACRKDLRRNVGLNY